MTKNRYAARVDENQTGIVEKLRQIPGMSVETGHDDLLSGNANKKKLENNKN